jgi:hypothetical protein
MPLPNTSKIFIRRAFAIAALVGAVVAVAAVTITALEGGSGNAGGLAAFIQSLTSPRPHE